VPDRAPGPISFHRHVFRGDAGSTRSPALDGLRAIAIGAVILFHIWHRFAPGGFIGVDLFFVISGYVITRSLASELRRTGGVSIRDFYVRRARRILPALLVFMAGAATLSLAVGRGSGSEAWAALAVATSSLNWFLALGGYGTFRTSWFVHVWSLSVEEQFYLLWPLAFGLLARRGNLRVMLVVLAVGILLSAACAFLATAQGAPWARAYFGSDARAQGLLAGCLLAAAGTRAVPVLVRKLWPAAALTFIAMVVAADNHGPFLGLGGFALAALVSAWLVAAAAEDDSGRLANLLSARPLVWVGLRSYSLFLWHYPIAQALYAEGLPYWSLLTVVLSLVVADLSYRLVERPFLRSRSRALPGDAAEEQAAP